MNNILEVIKKSIGTSISFVKEGYAISSDSNYGIALSKIKVNGIEITENIEVESSKIKSALNITGEDAEFIFSSSELTIKKGKNKISIPAKEAKFEDFSSECEFVSVNAKSLANDIKTIKYACAKDDKRPILKGLSIENGIIRATNGFQVAKIKTDAKITLNPVQPDKMINILNACDQVEIGMHGTSIIIKENENVYKLSTLMGQYPETEKFFTSFETTRAIPINKNKIASYLKNAKEFEQKVKFTFEGQDVTLSNTKVYIDLENELDSPANLEIMFNTNYLLDAINSYEDEQITLMFNDKMAKIVSDKIETIVVSTK